MRRPGRRRVLCRSITESPGASTWDWAAREKYGRDRGRDATKVKTSQRGPAASSACFRDDNRSVWSVHASSPLSHVRWPRLRSDGPARDRARCDRSRRREIARDARPVLLRAAGRQPGTGDPARPRHRRARGLKSKLDDASSAGRAAPSRPRQGRTRRRCRRRRATRSATRRSSITTSSPTASTARSRGERFAYGASAGRFAPYVLSQLTGAYRDVPDFLESQHRVRDAADADAYLARLEAFAGAIDDDTERQRADAARGVFAPDYILDTTLKQLAALARPAAASDRPGRRPRHQAEGRRPAARARRRARR